MADEIIYRLDVDDKGSPKLVKFGGTADKAGKQTSKAMKGASDALGELGQRIPGVGGAMSSMAAGPFVAAGAAVGVLAVGFGAVVKKSIDLADNINDLSLRLGISTERLSVLSLYAEQSGTDIETLASAMGKLGVKMSEGDKTLKSYGITATTVDEGLYQLADMIAGTEDPMLRLKIATDAFGKSGQQMLPLLVQGGAALRDMSDAAPVVSSEMAKMADEFNDKMSEVKGTFTAIGLEIGSAVLPMLSKMADFAKDIATSLKGGVKALDLGESNWGDEAERIRKELERPDISSRRRRSLERDLANAEAKRVLYGQAALEERIGASSGPGSMGGYRGELPPDASRQGVFGAGALAGAGKASPASINYLSDSQMEEMKYRYNAARPGLAAEPDGEAQNADFLAMHPDYYAGLPVSDKGRDSLEAQYDAAAQEERALIEQRAAENAKVFFGVVEAMRGDMQGSFSQAFTQICQDGRNAFDALYDAFSERFTARIIDSLANLAANGLLAALVPGSAPAGGILGLLGFASGGNPPVGVPSTVGERRAETIIPRGPSRVQAVASTGSTFNITVSSPTEARSMVRQLKSDERKRVRGIR